MRQEREETGIEEKDEEEEEEKKEAPCRQIFWSAGPLPRPVGRINAELSTPLISSPSHLSKTCSQFNSREITSRKARPLGLYDFRPREKTNNSNWNSLFCV